MKKILLILLFPFMAQALVACCDCPPVINGLFTNQSFTVLHLDNSGALPEPPQGDSVSRSQYAMRLEVATEKTARLWQKRPSFFASANAAFDCFCDDSYLFAKDSITAIFISSDRDFDAAHPTGSDLSHYFRSYTPDQQQTITEFLQTTRQAFMDQSDRNNYIVNLRLVQPPVQAGRYHTFSVRLQLSDGRTLETTASPVKLY